MEEQPYPFRPDLTEFSYRFESVSDRRILKKIVSITDTGRANVVNLALLDELDDGELSDVAVSDNDDMITVLATVFRIAADFLDRFPAYSLAFRGSDERRNRLYRIALGRELIQLNKGYELYEFNGEQFALFARNQPYSGFLIRKRK